jgi:Spy/CpxP family protein refolding chaperone
MKHHRIFILVLFAIFIAFTHAGQAQHGERGKNLAKVDQLEKVKLIDALQMNDETSIKFFNRRRAFKEKQRSTMQQMDNALDELQGIVKSSGEKDLNRMKALNEELIRLESQFHRQREDYLAGLSEILTTEQISKLAVFERDFRREIKDAILKKN